MCSNDDDGNDTIVLS